MIETLTSTAYAPFSVAFVVMLGIGLIEAIGLSAGHLDVDADADMPGGTLLDWLGAGSGLPILIWLTSLLGCFTIAGLALQQIVTGVFGGPLNWGVASAAALPVALLANGFAARGLARIMPGYESTVISADDLLMRRGVVLEGTARRNQPARAKVTDHFGQAHYIMIEPHDDGDAIAQGETALLVRKDGPLFLALPDRDSIFRAE